MLLTVRKADGQIRKVELRKESMQVDDDEHIKSFVLRNNNQAIGYISLPAFYTDWETGSESAKGCANDLAKEILRLRKENISGLIFDLRYNGGGSMQEAVDLSGLFIDAGPVAQLNTEPGKMVTLKDVNRGTVYDGPLLILVNGVSASASELVTGTLQDYHRAVIMGSVSYGKATGQVILPLDTVIRKDLKPLNKQDDAFCKITVEKLYRVTGASIQAKGVMPDILLPDITSIMPKEADEQTVLKPQPVDANKFYTPYPVAGTAALITAGISLTDTVSWLQEVKQAVDRYKIFSEQKDIPLEFTDALRRELELSKLKETASRFRNEKANVFTASHPAAEEQKLKLFPDLKEMNEAWKALVEKDEWVRLAFRVLTTKN
jgi:carboxyl-terminal processing protease